MQKKRTTLLFYHVFTGTEGANQGNEVDGQQTFDVIEAMILQEVVGCMFLFLFDITEGMGNGKDLSDVLGKFYRFVICTSESLHSNGLMWSIVDLRQDLFFAGAVQIIGKRKGLGHGDTCEW